MSEEALWVVGVSTRVLKRFMLRPERQIGGPTPGWLSRYGRVYWSSALAFVGAK